jgi:MEMO1 family protein
MSSNRISWQSIRLMALFVGVVVVVGILFTYGDSQMVRHLNKETARSTHPLLFYNSEVFYQGIEAAKKEDGRLSQPMVGGIIPHHLLPSYIIAGFFHRLALQKPKTIILVGPNHEEKGNFPVLTSLLGWETPTGMVETNESIINTLLKSGLAHTNDEVLTNDHAVAGIMPFINYYLPTTTVVPLLLSRTLSQAELELLASKLYPQLGNDVVLVAAVDFSHYLTGPQAEEKDATTLALMQSNNYPQLLLLSNDYFDSPPSIVLLLMSMNRLGATEANVLYHTNSGVIAHNSIDPSTSYFSIMYSKPASK